MDKILQTLIISSVVTLSAYSKSAQSYIVLLSSDNQTNALQAAEKYKVILNKNETLKNIVMSLDISQSNKVNIVKVGPFSDVDVLTLSYLELRQSFPQSFIINDPKVIVENVQEVKYVDKEDRNLWMALFGLGSIGIFALFMSSAQLKKLKKRHNKLKNKQKEIEKKQSLLLEKMGEKIQHAALTNVATETKLLSSPLETYNDQELKSQISNLKKYDEDLLRTTYEMIDFLKIKSGNIVVKQEAFQVSNMLHKLTNAIAPDLKDREYTLYYDISNEVTRYLIGDTNRIFQVLHNLLLDLIERRNYGEIVINIYIRDDEELVFLIKNEALFLSTEVIDTLFIPQSWEDAHYKHKEFGFYVLNELVDNMNGALDVESHEGKGTQYTLSLPYIHDLDNKSRKKELIKVLSSKKALVIDNDLYSAKILIDILGTFDIDVLFKSSENLETHRPDLEGIDFIILKSEDVSQKVSHFFKNLNKKESLDIIIIHNVFSENTGREEVSYIADAELYSPLIVGDVEEVLKQLYIRKARRKKDIRKEGLKDFKILDTVKVEIEDFAKFKDKTILMVEDNFVSQQVMSSILSASQLTILKAENGREALDILEEHLTVDLIFLDMNMPIIDGFDVTREIRKNNKYKKVPIVAVTGLGFNYEVEKMLLAGVDACIIKPYRFGQLYVALEKFLDPSSFSDSFIAKRIEIENQNTMVLDISKGLSYVRSESFYNEIVAQILLALRNSDTIVRGMIVKDEIDELRAFCVDALGLSATIGATGYVVLLKEMLMEMKEEDVYLSQYIPKYKDKWLELEKEMKRFLKR
ncbi:MAG TPA: response regulator [Sulfurovum sp.]|nr:response regulator [Sulfurovum sp.]